MVETFIWNKEGGRRTWSKNTMQHATYTKFDSEFPLP